MNTSQTDCARCPYKPQDRFCKTGDGKAPDFCPTRNHEELLKNSLNEYLDSEEIGNFARQSAIQESEGYTDKELGYSRLRPCRPRIEETMVFAEKMGFRRLGLAFCIGLRKEAKVVADIFSAQGFDVVSVICKAGRIPKAVVGVTRDQQLDAGSPETMCNPVFQAKLLNEETTDFNVLLGLCVGHDSLFLKYAQAPCTVLAVKDRLLGHNPLACIYNIDSYYRSMKSSG